MHQENTRNRAAAGNPWQHVKQADESGHRVSHDFEPCQLCKSGFVLVSKKNGLWCTSLAKPSRKSLQQQVGINAIATNQR